MTCPDGNLNGFLGFERDIGPVAIVGAPATYSTRRVARVPHASEEDSSKQVCARFTTGAPPTN